MMILKRRPVRTSPPPSRYLFLRVGLSDTYYLPNGPLRGDAAYIRKTGTGVECMNFRPFLVNDGVSSDTYPVLLGSFETMSHRDRETGEPVVNRTRVWNIRGCEALRNYEKLSYQEMLDREAEEGLVIYAPDVTVIWCSWDPDRREQGFFVVGWYRSACVYSTYQCTLVQDPAISERSYNVSCGLDSGVLLPLRERTSPKWHVPCARDEQFGFGSRSYKWYAKESEAEEYVRNMLKNIETYDGENAIGPIPGED